MGKINMIEKNKIIQGDCIEEMKKLPENSIDAVVTDPPYGLAFMGKSWDDFKPKEFQEFSENWGREALRILKPGGYVLAFCGTRTYHRMVTGLEDAGFTIKDQIDWLYGQGFPKSYNISKGIEGKLKNGSANWKDWNDLDGDLEESKIGYSKLQKEQGYRDKDYSNKKHIKNVKFHTPEAKKWQGWGTALKPAHEPIVLAQKTREESYVNNILKYGVGGLNIDDCRIEAESYKVSVNDFSNIHSNQYGSHKEIPNEEYRTEDRGRFPANVLIDPMAGRMIDKQSGITKSGKGGFTAKTQDNNRTHQWSKNGEWNTEEYINNADWYDDKGGASRFFYSAKAHKSERNAGLEDLEDSFLATMGDGIGKREHNKDEYSAYVKNDIATLKPINLMRWLVRLVTPEDGVVLDPFGGSGTTGCAAVIERVDYILIEKRERFADLIAPKRIEYWSKPKNWTELKDHNAVPNAAEKRNGKLKDYI